MTTNGVAVDTWAHTFLGELGTDDVETVAQAWLDAVRIVDAVDATLRGRAPKFGEILTSEGYDVAELFSSNGASYLAGKFQDDLDRCAESERYSFTQIDTYQMEEVF